MFENWKMIMTQNRSFKSLVRTRMAFTDEAYTTARRQLFNSTLPNSLSDLMSAEDAERLLEFFPSYRDPSYVYSRDSKPAGAVLFCGPSGAGKMLTMFTLFNEAKTDPYRKLLIIDDETPEDSKPGVHKNLFSGLTRQAYERITTPIDRGLFTIYQRFLLEKGADSQERNRRENMLMSMRSDIYAVGRLKYQGFQKGHIPLLEEAYDNDSAARFFWKVAKHSASFGPVHTGIDLAGVMGYVHPDSLEDMRGFVQQQRFQTKEGSLALFSVVENSPALSDALKMRSEDAVEEVLRSQGTESLKMKMERLTKEGYLLEAGGSYRLSGDE